MTPSPNSSPQPAPQPAPQSGSQPGSQPGPDLYLSCVNPDCPSPRNALGRDRCAECQQPLQYRYLWAVGEIATRIPVGTLLAGRYYIHAPSIWLDTAPQDFPWLTPTLSPDCLPYLHLHDHSLHLPRLYGFCPMGDGNTTADVLLLENAPIGSDGRSRPTLVEAWPQATPLRRLHWLRQLATLWEPLWAEGVASSLLATQNLRVQGSCIKVRELVRTPASDAPPTLSALGDLWYAWFVGLATQVDPEQEVEQALLKSLQDLTQRLREPTAEIAQVLPALDELLLSYQAHYRTELALVGISEAGDRRVHNEDACYPDAIATAAGQPPQPLAIGPGLPAVAMVCDGIGGHERGEVASQMAVRSLQLQAQALATNAIQQSEPLPPEIVIEQLDAILRVTNNTINAQNNAQLRESRQRMGTTLALALWLPRRVEPPLSEVPVQATELYLTHVGDSRMYWITADACHCLTLDDDWAGRSVRAGERLYREALAQEQGEAMTQALGTKDAEFLEPTTVRWVPDADGVLLLCSDGFSDREWVERSWRDYVPALVRGERSPLETTQTWIDAAIAQNGTDNTTAVLIHCRLTPQFPDIPDPWTPETPGGDLAPAHWESEMSEASKALLYAEAAHSRSVAARQQRRQGPSPAQIALWSAIVMLGFGGLIGLWLSRPASTPNPTPPPTEIPSPQ